MHVGNEIKIEIETNKHAHTKLCAEQGSGCGYCLRVSFHLLSFFFTFTLFILLKIYWRISLGAQFWERLIKQKNKKYQENYYLPTSYSFGNFLIKNRENKQIECIFITEHVDLIIDRRGTQNGRVQSIGKSIRMVQPEIC